MLKRILGLINSSDLHRRVATGAFWSVVGSSVAKMLVLVAGIICANILGKSAYGELGLIRSTINMFVIFGTAGMGITATKYISQFRSSDKSEVARIFSVASLFTTVAAFVVSVAVVLFAGQLADKALDAPYLSGSIRFAALLLFVTILNSTYQGTLSGYEDFKRISINTFISSLIEAVLVILGALFYGVSGALVGYGVGIAFMTALNCRSVIKRFADEGVKVSYRSLSPKDFKILTQFSIPAALSSFLVVPSYWVVRTMIARYSGFSELGIYEAADQWRVIILFIPAALSNIILPILSSYIGTDETSTYKRALKMNISLNVGVSSVMAIAVSLLSRLILKSYGPGFDAPIVLIFLACSTVFSAFATVVGMSIVSQGKTWIGLLFNLVWALMFVAFSYMSLQAGYGASGVAFSLMTAYLLHGIFQFIYLKCTILRTNS